MEVTIICEQSEQKIELLYTEIAKK